MNIKMGCNTKTNAIWLKNTILLANFIPLVDLIKRNGIIKMTPIAI